MDWFLLKFWKIISIWIYLIYFYHLSTLSYGLRHIMYDFIQWSLRPYKSLTEYFKKYLILSYLKLAEGSIYQK